MAKVRVGGFSISLDGFGAGPEQSLENPLGKRGPELFAGIDLPALGYRVTEHQATENATHMVLGR
jgi:hypothetical protein